MTDVQKRPKQKDAGILDSPEKNSSMLKHCSTRLFCSKLSIRSTYIIAHLSKKGNGNRWRSAGIFKRDQRRVMAFIRRDIPKQKLRQQTSEHPFACIKHHDGLETFYAGGRKKPTRSSRSPRWPNLCGGV